MAITYPRTDILSLAKLGAGCSFRLQGYKEIGRTAGGQFIVADLADPVWVADYVTTGTMTHYEARELEAALASLDEGGLLFEGGDPRHDYPRNYPTGSFSDTGVIDNLPSDTTQIRLAGLPANFVIRAGDMFAFDYGTENNSRALHQAVEDITASAAGITVGGFTVRPRIRPGATVGTPVRFKVPRCYMAVVPGSIQVQARDRLFSTVRWQAVQVHAKP